MNKQLLKTVGTQAATQAVRRKVDLAFGFALLRDRRIPLGKKALALLLGIVGMVVIQALEIPLEALTVVFALPFGIEDELEALIWPVVLACGMLPYLLPTELTDRVRAERARPVE